MNEKKKGGDITFSLRKLALLGAIEQPIKLSSGNFAEAIKSSVQTAARRLQDLEKGGLAHRRITADGQWIMLTQKGVELLKRECYEYQELFFSTPRIFCTNLPGTICIMPWERLFHMKLKGPLYGSRSDVKLVVR